MEPRRSLAASATIPAAMPQGTVRGRRNACVRAKHRLTPVPLEWSSLPATILAFPVATGSKCGRAAHRPGPSSTDRLDTNLTLSQSTVPAERAQGMAVARHGSCGAVAGRGAMIWTWRLAAAMRRAAALIGLLALIVTHQSIVTHRSFAAAELPVAYAGRIVGDANRVRLVLDFDQPVRPRLRFTRAPRRMVVTMPNVTFRLPREIKASPSALVAGGAIRRRAVAGHASSSIWPRRPRSRENRSSRWVRSGIGSWSTFAAATNGRSSRWRGAPRRSAGPQALAEATRRRVGAPSCSIPAMAA